MLSARGHRCDRCDVVQLLLARLLERSALFVQVGPLRLLRVCISLSAAALPTPPVRQPTRRLLGRPLRRVSPPATPACVGSLRLDRPPPMTAT